LSDVTFIPYQIEFLKLLVIGKKVIAQLRWNKDFKGLIAVNMDSKADKPCRFPVLTIERTNPAPTLSGSHLSPYEKSHSIVVLVH
jgi:hypothetical protein